MKTFQRESSRQAFEVPVFACWWFKIWCLEDFSPRFLHTAKRFLITGTSPWWFEVQSNPRHGNTWVEPLSLVLDELCKKFVLSHHSSLHIVLCYGSTRTQIMLKHSFFDLKLEPLEDRRKNRKSIDSTQLAGSDLSVRLQNSKSVLCVLFLLDKNWQALIWVDRHLCKTIML